MKVSAPHKGWTSGRATPSLRPTPYAAETANPAGRHLSFAEICPDNRSQLCRRSGRAVQFDGIGDDADDATAAGALEPRVAGRGVFAGEKSATKAMGLLNDP